MLSRRLGTEPLDLLVFLSFPALPPLIHMFAISSSLVWGDGCVAVRGGEI